VDGDRRWRGRQPPPRSNPGAARRYHGTKSARVAPASLLFHAAKYRILFGRAPDGRVQNSRGFGLYACGNAPRHVIHLTSPAMYGGARRHKRVTRRSDSSRRRGGDVKLCRGCGASCAAGILIRVSTVNLNPATQGTSPSPHFHYSASSRALRVTRGAKS